MQAVADQVGVRAPSLYKRFTDRSALLTAVADDIATDLASAVATARHVRDPQRALRTMAGRYRAFARRSPHAYQLLFGSPGGTSAAPSPGTDALAAAGLLRLVGELVGPDDALRAARTLVAFAHGFVSMELAGVFRMGGDVDAAFSYGLDSIIRGLATAPS